MKKLEILLEGEKVMEVDADEFMLDFRHDLEEVRSNPALAASMAGAPIEEVLKLPGEQVAIMQHGGELTVTYKARIRWSKPRLGEFRPALP